MVVSLDQAAVAVADTVQRHAFAHLVIQCLCDTPERRIQSLTVTAARKHSDFHIHRPSPAGLPAVSFSPLSDIQFSKGDAVSAKAAELCKNAKTDEEKVVAIYNYMADRYSYDYKLANEITSGKITKYIPDTAATLNGTTGMRYDFSSLFAAMCRSEGIPCALTKGYAGSSYHAWNKVNLNGSWYQIDLTYAVTRNVRNAKTLHDCVSPLTYTNTSDTLAAAAA